MAIFDVKVLSGGFSFFAGRFPREAAKEMRDAAWKTATRFRSVFVKTRLSGRPGLNRITGSTIRSFRVGRSPAGAPLDQVVSWLASGSPHIMIHERGGTIRPKRRRMLAVPLAGALAEGGGVRGESVRLMPAAAQFGQTSVRKGERSLYARKDLTLIVRGHGRAPLLVKKFKTRWTLMYVLVKSVRIPARLKFHDTFRSWSRKPAALRFFSSGLRRLIDKLWGRGGKA